MPYLGDFSHILQGEYLASTANGSIIQMHGPSVRMRGGVGLSGKCTVPFLSSQETKRRQQ
jgi:hypothetical protein